MSGIGTLAKDIRQAITGELPPEKQAELQNKVMEIELQAAQAQTKINEIEAGNTNIFVSGWRPFCGWVGGAALAWAALLEPICSWVAEVCFGYKGTFPAIDTNITMQILFGILGLGAYRAVEKVKGGK
jgi:hypothetical protein